MPTCFALALAMAPAALAQAISPSRPGNASEQELPSAQSAGLRVPTGLPVYELDVSLASPDRRVSAQERVWFTNRSGAPVTELVFHVYPRYRVPESDRLILYKTLEMLRLSPEEAMDLRGHRLEIGQVRVEGREVSHSFDSNESTILVVPLPKAVPPGEAVRAEIEFRLDLPDTWGRWGQHDGITYLVNWYPVLAHHDDRGWERTPFVPWHQPWHQEAGHYTVRIDLPGDQVVASSGRIVARQGLARGAQRLTITASPARDFALVASNRFRTWQRQVGATTVRVLGFPEHEPNATRALEYACEVIPLYEGWFGPYPDSEFEIAPSFFGWNGNECSGLVLLDDRVMRLPSAGHRYLDHLVTHETCHQWWWNVVGTDGYAETFMDEGLVNCFTALRLDAKYGRNAPLIVWPRGLGWLPTIGREDLRLAGYYGWRARGNSGPVIQDLGSMGNLNTLFSLAYDRGGKVVGMVRNRLGEDRFFAFFQQVYRGYAYETLRYEDLKRELVAYDPAGNWSEFLDGWLIEHRDTDWSVERVSTEPTRDDAVRLVTVELAQKGEMVEPTVVLCRAGDGEIRVPIWPEADSYEVPGAKVERREDRWIVRVESPSRPTQVEVDPDHALLDARPDNNRWKPEVHWRLTPVLTPLDTAGQFQAYDRASVVAGPFIDQYARGGFKAGLQRLDRWQVIGWAGTEPALSEAIFGGQGQLLNWPGPMWTAGVYYEEGLYNFYNDRRHSGGRAFLRKRLIESSSVLVDDPGFFEFYLGTGNEFWPGDDGRPVNGSLTALGGRYRLSTLFPYWDPVQGELIDVSAEYGDTALGSSRDYVRLTGEYGRVWSLPDATNPIIARSRFAARAYGGWSWPDTSPFFRLGGGRRLRALDLVTQTGSSVWLTTLEWRFPLWRSIDRDLCDHVVTLRNLYGAAFYDVGQSYLDGRWGPVVHGPGFGLRLDVTLFSFLERATLRADLAQPIGISGGPVIWFGLNQVF
jgi:hypothetical protein